jgi:hypothetical protein
LEEHGFIEDAAVGDDFRKEQVVSLILCCIYFMRKAFNQIDSVWFILSKDKALDGSVLFIEGDIFVLEVELSQLLDAFLEVILELLSGDVVAEGAHAEDVASEEDISHHF